MPRINVYFEGVSFGDAPVILPPSQVQGLLCPGDIVVDDDKRSGPSAGIEFDDNGGMKFLRGGNYKIYHARQDERKTLRSAQLICGLVGAILINFLIYTDPNNAMATFRDFLINFGSDVLAIGFVLLVAYLLNLGAPQMLRQQMATPTVL